MQPPTAAGNEQRARVPSQARSPRDQVRLYKSAEGTGRGGRQGPAEACRTLSRGNPPSTPLPAPFPASHTKWAPVENKLWNNKMSSKQEANEQKGHLHGKTQKVHCILPLLSGSGDLKGPFVLEGCISVWTLPGKLWGMTAGF